MKNYLNSINKNGYVIIKNVYKKKFTKIFKRRLEKILTKRIKKNAKVGNETNQVLYNYFNDDTYLLRLIYNKKIDPILKKLLDENYVLQSSNAQNRILNKFKISKKKSGKGIG